MDRGPLSLFAAATLQVASREAQGKDMAVRIKLWPFFSSSKYTKYELIVESILSKGPLWHNTNYMERKNNGEVIVSQWPTPMSIAGGQPMTPPAGGLNTRPLAD